MSDVRVSFAFKETSHLRNIRMSEKEKQVDYTAYFFTESPGSKKGLHRGPMIYVNTGNNAENTRGYELVIGDDGIPKMMDVSAEPVVPSFARATPTNKASVSQE